MILPVKKLHKNFTATQQDLKTQTNQLLLIKHSTNYYIVTIKCSNLDKKWFFSYCFTFHQ